jgi:tRNA nucleotidyltransferase (CCA-adding enzyme)
VGGAARDLLLGRDVNEVDVAVGGQADRVAAAMERAEFGRAVELSSRPPRVFRVAGKREIDIAEIEGESIEQDLWRRDFTVNAIAFDLARGEWLDPFGGRDALASGVLRMVRPRNLREDPLRVLRAARFIATHLLRPDRATSRACRAAAPGLSGVAPERVRVEWVKLIRSPRAAEAIAWAGRAGALAPAFRIDPRTAGRLARSSAKFDAAPIRRLAPEDRQRARLALLGAAVGVSSERAAAWLSSLRYGRSEAGDTAALLRLAGSARELADERSLWTWVRDAGPLARAALAVGKVLHPRRAPLWRKLDRRVARARRGAPGVSGSDVIDWTGLPPGPEIGRLLSGLEVESLRGTVRTRRQARAWISRQVSRPPGQL